MLGLWWRGRFWHRTCLSFGLRSSPIIFTRLAATLCDFVRARNRYPGCCRLFQYLDDFLAVGCAELPHAPDQPPCAAARDLAALFKLLSEATGFLLKPSKERLLVTSLIYRGLLLDSVAQTVALDAARIARLRAQLLQALAFHSLPLRELQRLCGRLAFAAQVISPGRMMLARLWRLLAGDQHPRSWRRIGSATRGDIAWWYELLSTHNGVSLLRATRWDSADTLHVYTDASDLGAGGWCRARAFATHWLPHERTWPIARREALAIALAVQSWAPLWHGRRVVLHCDAAGTAHAFRTLSTRSLPMLALIRATWWACAQHDVQLRIAHIPGSDNVVADALSRFRVPLLSPARRQPLLPSRSLRDWHCSRPLRFGHIPR